jgi:hypothetical protein
MEYLNAIAPTARAYAVEIVKFSGADTAAYVARTVNRPSSTTSTPTSLTNETAFLEAFTDDYGDAVKHILDAAKGLSLKLEWGSAGVSIRLRTTDRPEPLTVAWIFPPGRSGWSGLTDLSMGVDPWSFDRHPSVKAFVGEYLDKLSGLEGAQPLRAVLRGSAFSPAAVIQNQHKITQILGELVEQANALKA